MATTMKFLAVLLLLFSPIQALVLPRTEQAPYYRAYDEKDHIADEYGVFLAKNYTIEEHFDFIGVNLEQNATTFARMSVLNAYRAKIDSHTVHNLIRYDPGVRYVQHDTSFELDLQEPAGGDFILHSDDPQLTKRAFGFGPPTDVWTPCKQYMQMITNGLAARVVKEQDASCVSTLHFVTTSRKSCIP